MSYADPWSRTDTQWIASLKRAGKVFDAVKPWPKLRIPAEGRPFAPAGVEVGAWVAWTEHEPVRSLSGIPTGEQRALERVGQVWAPAPARQHVYVVDLERRAHELAERDLRPAVEPGEQIPLDAARDIGRVLFDSDKLAQLAGPKVKGRRPALECRFTGEVKAIAVSRVGDEHFRGLLMPIRPSS